MLPEQKRNTNIGVGMGILLQFASAGLEAPLAFLVAFVGLVFFIWGCTSYMKGKGYSPAWGLLGLLSIMGLIILALFPDRHKGA